MEVSSNGHEEGCQGRQHGQRHHQRAVVREGRRSIPDPARGHREGDRRAGGADDFLAKPFELAELEARVGTGNVLFAQVEAIVRRALDDFEWNTLRGLIQSELLSLVLTGRSVVKDDDTDLA